MHTSRQFTLTVITKAVFCLFLMPLQSAYAQVSGLVSYWPGEGNANDIQGANNGSLQGGAVFAPGLVGQAFSLDGVSRYIVVPDSPSLSITGPLTLEARIKINTNNVQQAIIEKYDVPGRNGYFLRFNGAGKLEASICNSLTCSTYSTGATTLTTGTWHHVAAVYDGSSIKVYLDGTLDGSVATNFILPDGTSSLKIGARGDDANTRLNGLIDEVKIYNRALSAAELQGLAGITPLDPCLLQNFEAPRHFSNGSTTVRVDIADFNNDGNSDIAATAHDASYVGVFLGDGTGNFTGPTILSAGNFNVPVAAGDFNGDGNADLAVGSRDGTVWIYLGNGTGAFGPPARYADGSGEDYEMAVDDFNHDGKLDLAIGHQFGGLAIMLGNGGGGFSLLTTYIAGAGPVKVAKGDFNNDGNTDLITANAQGHNSSLLLGNGAGSFAVSTLSVPATDANSGFAIGDFDRDGNIDFGTSSGSDSIKVYYGDGQGGFPSTRIFAGSANKDPHAADFNGDGILDIVATGHPDPTATIMLGDGSGGFGSATSFPVGQGPQGSAVGDFNHDGKLDVVTPNYMGGDITVMINNDGSLDTSPPVIIFADGTADATSPAGAEVPYSVSATDNSGRIATLSCDIPSGGNFPVGVTAILCAANDYCGNSSSQSFNITVIDQPPILSLPGGITSGDACPSGKAVHYTATATDAVSGDLPVSCSPATGSTFPIGHTTVTCSVTDGGGHTAIGTFDVDVFVGPVATFAGTINYEVGSIPGRIAIADFNKDGKRDMAVTSPDSSFVAIFLGTGNGNFGAPDYFPAGGFSVPVSVGDFNQDTNPDIAVGSWDGNVWIYLGNGSGGFNDATMFPDSGGEAYEMVVDDFNLDGKQDLAIAHQFTGLAILLGDGSGGFSSPVQYLDGSGPVQVRSADFNNDGKTDLVTSNAQANNASILLGDGSGGFTVSTLDSIPGNNGVEPGDFNGDGKIDLVVKGDDDASVSLLLGNGLGGFSVAGNYQTGGNGIYNIKAADFNQDGKQDVAVMNVWSNIVSILLGDGHGSLSVPFILPVGNNPVDLSVADLNSDGKPDIATANYADYNVSVLLNSTEQAPDSGCDQLSPSTSAIASASPNIAGWNNSDVTISLLAVDNEGGSGVSEITYGASGANTISATTVSGNSASLSLSAAGLTTITYHATDHAGNIEQAHLLIVKIDKSAPELSCGSADGNWHAADVSIACMASDATSGLSDSGDASFNLTTAVAAGTEIANAATNSRQVCDNAGNCATAGAIDGNKIDKKAPVITVLSPVTNGIYLLNQIVTASYSCTDAGSGVASCVGTVANGVNIDTSSAGAKTFTVNATDNVGNSAPAGSVNYAVTYGLNVLFDQTRAVKSGSTIPIKLQLVDALGNNMSSAATVVHAVSLVQIATTASETIDDAGNANPDANFRFDQSLGGSGGYIFNLKTTGLPMGTYRLGFTVDADPTVYTVQFAVRQ